MARLVRDQYAAADAQERPVFATRFESLTARAEASLGRLASFARIDEQRARIAEVEQALARYRSEMDAFVRRTRENDGLIREMTQRADTLIDLTDRARLRQQASNADLARSVAEKVEALRVARTLISHLNDLRALVAAQAASPISGAEGKRIQARFAAASAELTAALRAEGRAADADALDALAAQPEPGTDGKLDAWIERNLKIETSGQESLHDEVAQLLAYSLQANEIEQATQNIALGTLKLGPRTTGALVRRDPALAERMLTEGERLGRSAAALPISPLIQAEMIQLSTAGGHGSPRPSRACGGRTR